MKALCLAAAAAFAFSATPASSTLLISIVEDGPNVFVRGSGNLDLSDAFTFGAGAQSGYVNGEWGEIFVGGKGDYGALGSVEFVILEESGPTFGSKGFLRGDQSFGDIFGVNAFGGYLTVPEDYVNGSHLSGITVFKNQTITSLGLTPGSYYYYLPYDMVTVYIAQPALVAQPVPEPATWAMMLTGFGFIGGALSRRTQKFQRKTA